MTGPTARPSLARRPRVHFAQLDRAVLAGGGFSSLPSGLKATTDTARSWRRQDPGVPRGPRPRHQRGRLPWPAATVRPSGRLKTTDLGVRVTRQGTPLSAREVVSQRMMTVRSALAGGEAGRRG